MLKTVLSLPPQHRPILLMHLLAHRSLNGLGDLGTSSPQQPRKKTAAIAVARQILIFAWGSLKAEKMNHLAEEMHLADETNQLVEETNPLGVQPDLLAREN